MHPLSSQARQEDDDDGGGSSDAAEEEDSEAEERRPQRRRAAPPARPTLAAAKPKPKRNGGGSADAGQGGVGDGSGSSAAQPTRRESRDKLHAPAKPGPVRVQQQNTIRLLGKVPLLLAALVAAVAANVELGFGSPATRVVKRSLLEGNRGLATGMGAQGTLLNMLCAVPLAAQWATDGNVAEVTGVLQKQRQNLVSVGILVAVGTSYRPFQAGDPLYDRLKEAGVPPVNLDPVCLLYTLYVFAIISGKIKLFMVMADCSFGLMRLFCGIIGNFNSLSAEDKEAGVRLTGSGIRREKRRVDFKVQNLFEGMRRDPSLLVSFVILVDKAHLEAKPGYDGSVFVITCEGLSWDSLEPLYAQLRALLTPFGDLDDTSDAEGHLILQHIVNQWASSGNALVHNLPIVLLLPGQPPIGRAAVLQTPRMRAEIRRIEVPPPPSRMLDLPLPRLKKSAEQALQRSADGVREAKERIQRAEVHAARRRRGVGPEDAADAEEEEGEEGAGASLSDPDGCQAQLAHWRNLRELACARLKELAGSEAAAAAAVATASKTAGKTSKAQHRKRKREDANDAVKALLRTKAKQEGIDLEESFQLEDGTVLKLELQTRKCGSSYYKGVSITRGRIEISHSAGVTTRHDYETEVDAAKAIAIAKHESN